MLYKYVSEFGGSKKKSENPTQSSGQQDDPFVPEPSLEIEVETILKLKKPMYSWPSRCHSSKDTVIGKTKAKEFIKNSPDKLWRE